MDRAKEAIETSFNERKNKFKEIFEIIDKHWECQLHYPLHVVDRFLNSEYFYHNSNKGPCYMYRRSDRPDD